MSSAVLVHMNGFGSWFQLLIQVRTSFSSYFDLKKWQADQALTWADVPARLPRSWLSNRENGLVPL